MLQKILLTLCLLTVSTQATNLLFIIADDLNDFIEPYNGMPYADTPNLRRLAEKSVVLENFYASSPVCHAARTALWYSADPSITGIDSNFAGDIEEMFPETINTTLHEALNDRGISVYGFGKIYHNEYHQHALEAFVDYPYADKIPWTLPYGGKMHRHADVLTSFFSGEKSGFYISQNDQDVMNSAYAVENFARKYLNGTIPMEEPFAMFFGFFEPHKPYILPIRHAVKDRQTPMSPLEFVFQDMCPFGVELLDEYQSRFDRFINVWRDEFLMYRSMVNYLDTQVGILLDALEAGPYGQNTVIVFTSDHGFSIGQRKWFGKTIPWRNVIHTPFFVHVPNSKSNGKKLTGNYASIDVYPTMLDLLDIKKIKGRKLHGRSFAEQVLDVATETPETRNVISTANPGKPAGDDVFTATGFFWKKWHLIEFKKRETDEIQYELYDVKQDPWETKNTAASHPDLIEKMLRIMNRRKNRFSFS